MKRELCALREGASKNENEGRHVERMRSNDGTRGEDAVEIVASDDMA